MTAFLVDPPSRVSALANQVHEAGAARLQAGDWAGAFRHYQRAYQGLLENQPPGKRFHKGLPLHNMGLARILGNDPREGLQYTFFAFLEDALSKADEGTSGYPELDGPAAHNLVFVFSLPPSLLSHIANEVRHLTKRGELFQDPSPLALRLNLWPLWAADRLVVADSPRISQRDFAATVAAQLRAAGISFEEDAPVNGLQVDYLVTSPTAKVVIEAKSAPARGRLGLESWTAAAESIKRATGAARVLVVVPDEVAADMDDSIITPISRIAQVVRTVVGNQHAGLPTTAKKERPRIFAAMPFSRKYHDTFFNAVRGAARAVNATAVRIDHDPDPGDVVKQIKVEIERAVVIIADLSEARPSVLHEYGYAEARDKPVIAITSSEMSATPFNVSHNTTHAYELGSTELLRKRLTKLLRAEFRRLGIIPPDRRRKK